MIDIMFLLETPSGTSYPTNVNFTTVEWGTIHSRLDMFYHRKGITQNNVVLICTECC